MKNLEKTQGYNIGLGGRGEEQLKRQHKVLIFAPHYHSFIKGSVNATAKHVSSITVLIRHNYLSELASYLPFSYFRHVEKYSRKRLVDLTGKPDNVHVNLVPMLYFIPDGRNKGLGDKLFKKFKEYIKKHDIEFDVIHAHFIWPHGYAAVKLGKVFEVPVVVTAHGYDVYDLPFRGGEWFEKVKYTLNAADRIITVSNGNKGILIEKLNVPKDKISVIPNGFDEKLFYPMNQALARKKLGLPLDREILLNVASLVPVKGHEYLIQAMKKVVRHRKDVLLVIVGDGPLKTKLQRMVNQLELNRYVMFAGARPHNEIPLWMNAADLFVMSSIREGCPVSLLEALGSGLPVVAPKIGGIPEIVTDECGVLLHPADPDKLGEAIMQAMSRTWRRTMISSCAQQYNFNNIAPRIMSIYSKIARG